MQFVCTPTNRRRLGAAVHAAPQAEPSAAWIDSLRTARRPVACVLHSVAMRSLFAFAYFWFSYRSAAGEARAQAS